jgi:hypothetical protein
MFGGVSPFLFSILQQRDRLKHPAVAKILSKDINPANAAILAVSRYWPAVYLGELTMHTAGLHRTTLQYDVARECVDGEISSTSG